MATTTSKTEPKKKGKGPWKTEMEEKLEQAIEIGVRSSSKAETRVHRVEFYLEQLTTAKLEVAYYEEMLRLEEQRASVADRYQSESVALEAELRSLTLRDQVEQARSRVAGVGVRTTTTVVDDDDGTVVVESSERRTRW